MNTTPAALIVGQRFTHDEVEYVINRITIHYSKDGRTPVRMQIDCMTVDEVVTRHNNLKLLLNGAASDVSEVTP